jgi:hypothetical protein
MATGYCRAKRIGTNAFALRYAVFVKTFHAYGTAAGSANRDMARRHPGNRAPLGSAWPDRYDADRQRTVAEVREHQ